MHARSGGILEIMGLLLGKVEGNTMIVMDSFALPVEGTETRVNAQAQAYEYMTAYIESAKVVSLYFIFFFAKVLYFVLYKIKTNHVPKYLKSLTVISKNCYKNY